MTKSKPEQLNAIVTFLLDNRAEIAGEDIERLALAFAPAHPRLPTASEAEAPEPEPDHSWMEEGEHGGAEFPAVAGNETMAIWKDCGTQDVCEITRGRRKGVIEIKYDGKPSKSTLAFLKSVKVKGSNRRAFNYNGQTQVWFGEAEYFVKLTARYQYVAGENTSELQAALDS
jgi:hypothetical protein